MPKRERKRGQSGSSPADHAARRNHAQAGRQTSGSTTTTAAATAAPGANGRPILRFVLTFGLCMAGYYGVSGLPVFRDVLFPRYLESNATIAAAMLRGIGQGPVQARDAVVESGGFGIEVARGCDAIEPMALLVSAILASPMALRVRLAGIVAGVLCLAALNLLRLVTLFLVGVHWPAAFELMHVDVWQVIFILLAVALWLAWAWWALRGPKGPAAAAGQTASISRA